MKKALLAFIIIIVAVIALIYTFPEKIAGYMLDAARSRAGLVKKEIKIDHHNIVYLEGGRGPAIVLLHGYSSSKDSWYRLSPYLKDYHVIIPDLPGHGESSKLINSRYDVASQIQRLHKFMQHLKIDKFNIAGNSMGGWFSGVYAVAYPDEVLSVGFFNAAGVKSPQMSDVMEMRQKGENPLLLRDEDDLPRLMSLIFFKPPYMPYPVRKMFVREARINHSFNEKIMNDITPDVFSLEKDLPKIKAPSLILWGDHDRIIDVSSVPVFEKGLKNYKTVIIKDCGHAPMIEKPQETAAAYLNFIKGAKN